MSAVGREGLSMMGGVVVPPDPDEQGDTRYARVVSVTALLKALRRRKLWIWTALAGLLIGASLHTVLPPKYPATTKLYLSEPQGADPNQAMANDVSLLSTRAVAQKAMGLLHETGSVSSFESSYRGVSLSTSILSITTSAGSSSAAVKKVNAIAQAFLSLRATELSQQTDVITKGLAAEMSKLQAEIQSLTTSISTTSSQGGAAANTVSDLVNQRSGDESQVAQLESQIQQDSVSAAAVTESSHVLDPGAVSGKSAKKVAMTDALSGLVGGLGIGAVVIVLSVLLSEGVRRRAMLAAILDAPVELSVGRILRKRAHPRRARAMLRRPPAELRMVQRRLADHLARDRSGGLVVVEVESALTAAVALLGTAVSLAQSGQDVVVIDSAQGRPLNGLIGHRARGRGLHEVTVRGSRIKLYTVPEDPAEGEAILAEGCAVVALATADPSFGCDHLAGLSERSTAIVTAGRADPEHLQATGQMLRQAGMPIESIILLDADRDDRTVGVGGAPEDAGYSPAPDVGFLATRRAGR